MRLTHRTLVLSGVLGLLCAALATAATTAVGTTSAGGKPVIGRPVVVPSRATAGSRFTVSFKVTRAGSGVRLTVGKMICDPSIAGRVISHAESFKGGTARLSFVVPKDAGGKMLRVKVTISSGGFSATRVALFRVQAAPIPALSVGDATVAEGDSGTTTLSFPVSLSVAPTQPVSVTYVTADGTATAPADYAAANGTLTFLSGEKLKTVAIAVVADTVMEPDETLTLALSNPAGATLGDGTAVGTITNDDTAVPVNPGAYQGSTSEGNHLFLSVLPDRTLTGFRVNSVTERCDPGGIELRGGVDWSDNIFSIGNDGSFKAQGSWTGSNVQGDAEWTAWSAELTGTFTSPTTATGTITINDELKYKGMYHRCTTGKVPWTAALVP